MRHGFRYWFKGLQCDNTKYIKLVKLVHDMMIEDLHHSPETSSWAKSTKS